MNNYTYIFHKKISRIIAAISFIVFSNIAFATHYRAGEITYKQIGQNTYRISVFTYTDYTQDANQFTESIKIDFGDNQSAVVLRLIAETLSLASTGFAVQRNTYTIDHTYKGNTTFKISIIDQNRVGGIANFFGIETDRFPFYVETVLTLNSGLGLNQSPVLSVPPIDQGCVGSIFTHNPGAYDPDGDSLRYEIRAPQIEHDFPMPKYSTPMFKNFFSIEASTGQLTWDYPINTGIYNIVIRIFEYRRGILIGYVDRDMQIYITACNNRPPTMQQVENTCVDALDTIKRVIQTTDPDVGQRLTVNSYGGPFLQPNSRAYITPTIPNGVSPLNFLFDWKPACSSIRYRAYEAIFKVTDNGIPTSLVDIKYWRIKVVGPSPKNVKIKLDSNGIKLTWNRDTCLRASAYKIFRKVDSSGWNPAKCETGVPASTGFVLIDSIPGLNSTVYFDNNFGKGLSPLIRYCYRITATYNPANDQGGFVYNEVSESYSSIEVCDIILRSKPIITNVSVNTTSTSIGTMFVKWIKPTIVDSILYPSPYQYKVVRSENNANNFITLPFALTYNSFSNIPDSVSIIDSNLNTADKQYFYKVQLYYTNKSNQLSRVDESVYAASIKAIPYNTDRRIIVSWKVDVPWINDNYTIYRKLPSSSTFDSLTTTNKTSYTDKELINGQEYCYYIKSTGSYNPNFLPDTLYNLSDIICGKPIDTVPPCPPPFVVVSPCENISNTSVDISWQYPLDCGSDIKFFRVYYRLSKKSPLVLVEDNIDKSLRTYQDTSARVKFSTAGCYVLTATDTNGNESTLLNEYCIENCPQYILPNVFTPDGDPNNLNNVFKPFPYRFIDKINITIYNRWGQEVYTAINPDVNWNGKDQMSGKDVTSGVYYYICDVFERYLDGIRKRSLHGTITLIR